MCISISISSISISIYLSIYLYIYIYIYIYIYTSVHSPFLYMYVCIYITHIYYMKVSKGYKINIIQLPELWMYFNICHGLYCFSVHSITPYSLFANSKCCKKSSFMFHFCIPTTKYQKEIVRKRSHLPSH